jgi:site-specific DNA recombinase
MLEAKKRELLAMLKRPVDLVPQLHPRLADLYREKVARLRDELNCNDIRTEAAEVIRDLIQEIRLLPENDRLEIDLQGDLAAILAFGNGSPRRIMPTGVQITMVAGERYHLYRTVIMWSSERAVEAKRGRRLDQYHGDVELIGRDLRARIGETRLS